MHKYPQSTYFILYPLMLIFKESINIRIIFITHINQKKKNSNTKSSKHKQDRCSHNFPFISPLGRENEHAQLSAQLSTKHLNNQNLGNAETIR